VSLNAVAFKSSPWYAVAAQSLRHISSTDLRKATRTSQSLRNSLLKFVQVFGVQTTQTAICNALSRIEGGNHRGSIFRLLVGAALLARASAALKEDLRPMGDERRLPG
jgi:predicted nucleic acid-binding protein